MYYTILYLLWEDDSEIALKMTVVFSLEILK